MPTMTNLRPKLNHKILGLRFVCSGRELSDSRALEARSEGGYTLVALLAMMSMMALFAMAVAPSIQQQTIREKEKEAIFRGEQVADAIRAYYINRSRMLNIRGDQALPSSMDQLVQGIPIPGGSKTRQILRASASRDPLTIEGEWRLIQPRTEALVDFQQSVMLYAGNLAPQPRIPEILQLQQFAAPQLVPVLNTGTGSRPTSSSSAGADSSGPFVGVASRSERSSVLTFYGIENHNEWIFTPLFRN
jgi:type II secretory pathway pseudopilin PulG